MDLLILALIAGFIMYRLFMALGEKTGLDNDDIASQENIIDFETMHSKKKKDQAGSKQQSSSKKRAGQGDIEEIDPFLREGIQKITQIDPEFSLKEFIEGATVAFEMIIDAYSKEDENTLKQLLSAELFQEFSHAIQERRNAGQSFDNTLVRIENVTVEDVKINDTIAQLHVKYISEQVPVIRDVKGAIIEGNPNQIDQIIDYWVFERNLRSKNPNWTLIATQI